MRPIALAFPLLFAAPLLAQDELPTDPNEPLEIEPPLLIQETPNRNIRRTTPDVADQKELDPERIAAALEKAKKSAASGERLYKSGIIAKVEAENRALKVIRLEADLAEANLELAKENVRRATGPLRRGRNHASRIGDGKIGIARRDERSAIGCGQARPGGTRRGPPESAAPEKLLAMGSGRKSEVNRAEEKVSALQRPEKTEGALTCLGRVPVGPLQTARAATLSTARASFKDAAPENACPRVLIFVKRPRRHITRLPN